MAALNQSIRTNLVKAKIDKHQGDSLCRVCRWRVCNLKSTKPHMNEMSNQNFENNGVNGTRSLGEGSSPSKFFLLQ